MEHFFFDGWTSLLRTLVIGVLAYTALLLFLRISGKRTLAKMNAFDLVVTVALGSTLASILISKDVTLAQGLLALLLLIGMQFVVTWTSVRVGWFRRMVTGEPTLLVYDGAMIAAAMKRMRVTEAEVEAAVREAGQPNVDRAVAVVLETDGSFSVVTQGDATAVNLATIDSTPAHRSRSPARPA